jgi:hypothetical protein
MLTHITPCLTKASRALPTESVSGKRGEARAQQIREEQKNQKTKKKKKNVFYDAQ